MTRGVLSGNGFNIGSGSHLEGHGPEALQGRLNRSIAQAKRQLNVNNLSGATSTLQGTIIALGNNPNPNLFIEIGELGALCREAGLKTEAQNLVNILDGFIGRFWGESKRDAVRLALARANGQ
jgi:hypothetical protein